MIGESGGIRDTAIAQSVILTLIIYNSAVAAIPFFYSNRSAYLDPLVSPTNQKKVVHFDGPLKFKVVQPKG